MITPKERADYYEALEELCQGYSSEQLATALIEAGLCNQSTTLATVAAHVRAAQNPNRNDYFKVGELILLTRFTGRLSILTYINRSCGCESPAIKKVTPKDEAVKLQRLQAALESELTAVTQRLSQLSRTDLPRSQQRDRVLFKQG